MSDESSSRFDFAFFSKVAAYACACLFVSSVGFGGSRYFALLEGKIWGFKDVFGWNAAQYLINYSQFGFIKRGLVGSLLGFLPTTDLFIASFWMALVPIVLLSIVASWFLFSKIDRLNERDKLKLRLLAITSPLTFLELGFDFGRFDALNIVFLIAAIYCLRRRYLFLAVLLNIAGLLTHELFFLYGSLFLIAFSYVSLNERSDRIVAGTALFVTTFAVCFLIFKFGKFESGGEVLYRRMLAKNQGLTFSGGSLAVWTRSLPQDFSFTFDRFNVVAFFGSLALMLITASLFLRRAFTDQDWVRLSTLAIFLAFPLGVDDCRWASLFFVVNFVLLCDRIGQGKELTLPEFNWRYGPCYLILCALPLGAVGIDRLFPMAVSAVEKF